MSEEMTDQQVNELYEKVQEPASSDIPMEKKPEATSLDPEMYEFTANGKQIKATKDEVLKWASQGHDYSQKMETLKSDRGDFDNTLKTYQEIDEYAKANPDWWNQVQDSYQSKDNVETPEDPALAQVMSELGELKQFKEEFVNEKKQVETAEADKMLDLQVKSIREVYPNLDWGGKNDKGHNLEQQVLHHALENNLGDNFKASFRDYMHDKLIAFAKEEGKETVGKDLAKKTKLGLLGETPTPTKSLKGADNIKEKSYEQLLDEGLSELGSS